MNETTVEAPRTATITVMDRCDLCQAQAYVRAVFEQGELHFCRHHYNNAKTKIDSTATEVVDETWQLSDARLDVSA